MDLQAFLDLRSSYVQQILKKRVAIKLPLIEIHKYNNVYFVLILTKNDVEFNEYVVEFVHVIVYRYFAHMKYPVNFVMAFA